MGGKSEREELNRCQSERQQSSSARKSRRDYSRLRSASEVGSNWCCERVLSRLPAQGFSNAHIARELGVNVDTVRLWRDRWVGWQGIDLETLSLVERLQDAPRPGVKPKFTTEQRCQMAALACEAPAQAGRPISQWTGREIADELQARGIVEQISPRHAARLLKKGDSNRTASATG